MLTIEASTTIISWAMARTARIHQRRSGPDRASGRARSRSLSQTSAPLRSGGLRAKQRDKDSVDEVFGEGGVEGLAAHLVEKSHAGRHFAARSVGSAPDGTSPRACSPGHDHQQGAAACTRRYGRPSDGRTRRRSARRRPDRTSGRRRVPSCRRTCAGPGPAGRPAGCRCRVGPPGPARPGGAWPRRPARPCPATGGRWWPCSTWPGPQRPRCSWRRSRPQPAGRWRRRGWPARGPRREAGRPGGLDVDLGGISTPGAGHVDTLHAIRDGVVSILGDLRHTGWPSYPGTYARR